MSNQEAIEVIRRNYPKTAKMVDGRYKGGFDDTEGEFGQALTAAIDALEKQVPKKVLNSKGLKNFNNKIYTIRGKCPICGSEGLMSHETDYCNCCGQKLDWEEISHEIN